MEELYGPERAAMLRVIGRRELLEEFERLKDKPRDTALYIDLRGRDPDDAATGVPYEKGAAFVRMLELAVGRPRFDAYLRSYFDQYAFQSMSTEEFVEDLGDRLFKDDRDVEARLQIRKWIYEPGLPSNAPVETSAALERVEQSAKAFADGGPVASIDARKWSTQEWIHFVASLPATLSPAQLTTLDRSFGLSEHRNSEVLFVWLRLAIRRHYQPALPALEEFLTSQGRRKFVRPLFQELLKTDWGRPVAERIFAQAKPFYHSVTWASVEELLNER
jgi:leukotriene-A4 hydrolase